MAKKKIKEYDFDEHVSQLRAILSGNSTPKSWKQLLLHLKAVPEDKPEDLKLLVDYAESSMGLWPEKMRRPMYDDWNTHLTLKKSRKKKKVYPEIFRLIGNFDEGPLLLPKDVTEFAPDSKSVTAMKSMAKKDKWGELGQEKGILWGIAIGSQGNYCVWVDESKEQTECSCPSRKRPCKHALGLLLLFANDFDIPETPVPDDHYWIAAESYYDSWE